MRSKDRLPRNPRRIISRYFELFLRERRRVLCPADIESVHRMRVASRCLRAALRIFQGILPAGESKDWRKEIRQTGRVLGRARELDIQIEFLEVLRKKPEDRRRASGIDALTEVLRKKRKLAQKKIVRELADFKIKRRFGGLDAWLKKGTAGSFHIQKRALVLKRLERFLELSPYVYRPQSIKELHRLLIAAKKLRYTLEILRPWYGAGMDGYIAASRQVQDLLGDLHEFDVLIGALGAFRKRPGKGPGDAAVYLMRECAGLRQAVYVKFCRLWKKLEEKEVWGALSKAA